MIAALVAGLLFGAILIRCALVVNALRFVDRGGRSWLAWEAFGLSYCVLVIAAGRSAWQIVHQCPTVGDWLWLVASTGLIVFDRRRKGTT